MTRIYFAAVFLLVASLQSEPASPDRQPSKTVTLRSYFENPPKIWDAVFEKELVDSSAAVVARKQSFRVRQDGANYLVELLSGTAAPISGGQLDGIKWEVHGGVLTEADPLVNPGASPLENVDRVNQMNANTIANWGLFEMRSGTAAFGGSPDRFEALGLDGQRLLVELGMSGETVSSLTLRDGSLRTIGFIAYQYDASFHEGRLPKNFTRYSCSAAGVPVAKLLAVNVSDLAVSYELVPKAALNPKEALRSSPKLVASYSNNVLHLLTPAGKVIPALTVEQNNLQLQNRVKGGVLVQVVGALALLLLLGALALIPLRLAWRYHRRNGKCVEDRRT